MQFFITGNQPIFQQIREQIEEAVFTGAFPEETQIPSTTEISTNYQINPATVMKGINLLVDDGLIYKKRGVGMFVKAGAREQIRKARQETFVDRYIKTMIVEAQKLGLDKAQVFDLIERGFEDAGN